MGTIAALHIAFASIALFICTLQLTFAFRRKGDIIFLNGAILSFLVFIHFTVLLVIQSPGGTSSAPVTILRYRLILSQIVIIGFLRVLFYLLKSPPKLLHYIILTLILLNILMGAFLPDRILYGANPIIRMMQMPEGDQIVMIRNGFTLWRIIRNTSIVLFIGESYLMLSRKQDQISIRTSIALYSGLSLILVAAVYDQLIDLEIVPIPYLYPFSEFIYYSILTFIPFYYLNEQNTKQHNLLNQYQSLRDFVEGGEMIIVRLNRMGTIESVNPFFCKLTGYEPKEVIGKDWFEFLIPTKDYYKVQGTFLEILDSELYPKYINPILTKTNAEIQILWFNARSHDSAGIVTGSLSIGVDIDKDIREKTQLQQRLNEAEELVSRLSSQPDRG
jgi:PAS domain S-box-containing protein